MDAKPRQNRQAYLQILSRMTPGQRLEKAFELSKVTKALFKQGLRRRFPAKSEDALHQIYLDRLAKWHNRNY